MDGVLDEFPRDREAIFGASAGRAAAGRPEDLGRHPFALEGGHHLFDPQEGGFADDR